MLYEVYIFLISVFHLRFLDSMYKTTYAFEFNFSGFRAQVTCKLQHVMRVKLITSYSVELDFVSC